MSNLTKWRALARRYRELQDETRGVHAQLGAIPQPLRDTAERYWAFVLGKDRFSLNTGTIDKRDHVVVALWGYNTYDHGDGYIEVDGGEYELTAPASLAFDGTHEQIIDHLLRTRQLDIQQARKAGMLADENHVEGNR